jgi:hypothetical protein
LFLIGRGAPKETPTEGESERVGGVARVYAYRFLPKIYINSLNSKKDIPKFTVSPQNLLRGVFPKFTRTPNSLKI